MSSSKAKKVRQYYRRDLRHKLGLEVELAQKLVKPRPKWLPVWVWAIGARMYFNKALFDQWFNNKN